MNAISRRMDGVVTRKPGRDPVASLGREIAQLRRVIDKADGAEAALPQLEKVHLPSVIEEFEEEFDVKEGLATLLEATSAEGALVQAMIARADAECLHSWVEEEHRSRCDGFLRRIDRMLHSIAAVLERESGVSREELGGSYYLNDCANPHVKRRKMLKHVTASSTQ